MRVRCVCVIAAPQQPCVRVEKPERGKGQKEKEKHRGMVAQKPDSHHPALPSSRRVTRAREGARALHTHTHTHSLSSHPLRTPWHPRGSPSSGERGGGEGEREQRAQTSRLLFFFLLLRKPAAGPSTSPPPLFFPQHSPTPAAPPAAEPLAHACTWDPADLSAGSKKWRWGRRQGGGGGGSESSSGERGGERRRERERRRATALDTKKRNSLRPSQASPPPPPPPPPCTRRPRRRTTCGGWSRTRCVFVEEGEVGEAPPKTLPLSPQAACGRARALSKPHFPQPPLSLSFSPRLPTWPPWRPTGSGRRPRRRRRSPGRPTWRSATSCWWTW